MGMTTLRSAMAGLSTGPSFDQLMDEARFHYVVKRDPLRANSEAWTRVEAEGRTSVPEEMKNWVSVAKVEETAARETASAGAQN